MPTNVIMPALGVAQQTGTLLKWLKAAGQTVTKGEPLMEIETDKATVEIEASASGVLTGISAKPGDEVPVGQTIALILAPGDAPNRRRAHGPEQAARAAFLHQHGSRYDRGAWASARMEATRRRSHPFDQ